MTHEALAHELESIRDERTTDLRNAPVVRRLLETRAPRHWSEEEIGLAREAAEQVRALITA